MRPAIGAGTSIAAFSVSSVINGVSFSICLTVLDQDVDDIDVFEAADVGNQNFDWSSHGAA